MTGLHAAPPSERAASIAAIVSSRLRGLRHERGWSLAEAARRLQVTQASLGTHERGDRAMTCERVAWYERAYGVPAGHLWGPGAAWRVPPSWWPRGCSW